MEAYFNWFLIGMTLLGLFVFIALYFVKAGYGVFFNKKWGPAIPNRVGWILMEAPVFFVMLWLWMMAGDRATDPARLCMFLFFELHYFQRSFIFPFLFKSSSPMAISIMLCGIVFNTLNALMQGGWLFYISPVDYYDNWFSSPQFLLGTILFFCGMIVNIHSDSIIRNLRKPGDKKHYLPHGGMFRYVSSANYFGELVEWIGFAILTWSWAGAVFAWWTFANLTPRAHQIYKRYVDEFGEEFIREHRKRIIPFIY